MRCVEAADAVHFLLVKGSCTGSGGARQLCDMRTICVALLLCLSTPALADKPALKGTFAWDFMKPKKSTCAKTTAAVEKTVGKYDCTVPDKGTTASGKDAVASCTSKDGKDGYIFFAALADCKTERETQLANGE